VMLPETGGCRSAVALLSCSATHPRCSSPTSKVCSSLCEQIMSSCGSDPVAMAVVQSILTPMALSSDCSNSGMYSNASTCIDGTDGTTTSPKISPLPSLPSTSPTSPLPPSAASRSLLSFSSISPSIPRCEAYRGSVCHGLLGAGSGEDGVYIPAGYTQELVESRIELGYRWTWNLAPLANGCQLALARFICNQAFMPCSYAQPLGPGTPKTVLPRALCRRHCLDFESRCSAVGLFVLMEQLRPNCTSIGSETSTLFPPKRDCTGAIIERSNQPDFPINETTFQPGLTSRCNDYATNSTGGALSDSLMQASVTQVCPHPLVVPTNPDTDQRVLGGPCANPCPTLMFNSEQYHRADMIILVTSCFSFVLGWWTLLSWLLDKSKRSQFAIVSFLFCSVCLSCFLLIEVIVWVAGGGRVGGGGPDGGVVGNHLASAGCATNTDMSDLSTVHLSKQSMWVTALGTIQIYNVECMVAWWALNSVDLFMKVVLNSQIVYPSRAWYIKRYIFFAIGFGLPLIVASLSVALGISGTGGLGVGFAAVHTSTSPDRSSVDGILDWPVFYLPIILACFIGLITWSATMATFIRSARRTAAATHVAQRRLKAYNNSTASVSTATAPTPAATVGVSGMAVAPPSTSREPQQKKDSSIVVQSDSSTSPIASPSGGTALVLSPSTASPSSKPNSKAKSSTSRGTTAASRGCGHYQRAIIFLFICFTCFLIIFGFRSYAEVETDPWVHAIHDWLNCVLVEEPFRHSQGDRSFQCPQRTEDRPLDAPNEALWLLFQLVIPMLGTVSFILYGTTRDNILCKRIRRRLRAASAGQTAAVRRDHRQDKRPDMHRTKCPIVRRVHHPGHPSLTKSHGTPNSQSRTITDVSPCTRNDRLAQRQDNNATGGSSPTLGAMSTPSQPKRPLTSLLPTVSETTHMYGGSIGEDAGLLLDSPQLGARFIDVQSSDELLETEDIELTVRTQVQSQGVCATSSNIGSDNVDVMEPTQTQRQHPTSMAIAVGDAALMERAIEVETDSGQLLPDSTLIGRSSAASSTATEQVESPATIGNNDGNTNTGFDTAPISPASELAFPSPTTCTNSGNDPEAALERIRASSRALLLLHDDVISPSGSSAVHPALTPPADSDDIHGSASSNFQRQPSPPALAPPPAPNRPPPPVPSTAAMSQVAVSVPSPSATTSSSPPPPPLPRRSPPPVPTDVVTTPSVASASQKPESVSPRPPPLPRRTPPPPPTLD